MSPATGWALLSFDNQLDVDMFNDETIYSKGCSILAFGQDMSRQPPTQELVAKDLHGSEWRFRHIFRGKNYLLASCSVVSSITFMGCCHT